MRPVYERRKSKFVARLPKEVLQQKSLVKAKYILEGLQNYGYLIEDLFKREDVKNATRSQLFPTLLTATNPESARYVQEFQKLHTSALKKIQPHWRAPVVPAIIAGIVVGLVGIFIVYRILKYMAG